MSLSIAQNDLEDEPTVLRIAEKQLLHLKVKYSGWVRAIEEAYSHDDVGTVD